MLPVVAVSEGEDDEEVDLATLDIEENGDQNTGNMSNVYITVLCALDW